MNKIKLIRFLNIINILQIVIIPIGNMYYVSYNNLKIFYQILSNSFKYLLVM